VTLDPGLDLPGILDRSGRRAWAPIPSLHKVGEAAGEFATDRVNYT